MDVTLLHMKYRCRVCLSMGNDHVDIFTQYNVSHDIASILMECSSLQISRNDRLPTVICTTCFKSLHDCDKFRKLCIESDRKLKSYLNSINTDSIENICQNKSSMIKNYNTNMTLNDTKTSEVLPKETISNNITDVFIKTETCLTDDFCSVEIKDSPSKFNQNKDYCSNNNKDFIGPIKQEPVDKIETEKPLTITDNEIMIKTEPVSEDVENIETSALVKEMYDLNNRVLSVENCMTSAVTTNENYNTTLISVKNLTQLKENKTVNNNCGNLNQLTKNVISEQTDKSHLENCLTNCTKQKIYMFDAVKGGYVSIDLYENEKPSKKNTTVENKQQNTLETNLQQEEEDEEEELVNVDNLSDENDDEEENDDNENLSVTENMLGHTESSPDSNLTKPVNNNVTRGTEGPFECPKCKKKLKTSRILLRHLLRHRQDKSHVCKICNKSFVKLGYLRMHERSHTDEKLYKCDKCDKSFRQRSNLIIHANTHSSDQPFTCTECNSKFKFAFHLYKHKKSHWDVKRNPRRYVCETCNKAFLNKHHLITHQLVHTDDKQFFCNMCSKGFKLKHHLGQHLRTHVK